MENKNNLEMNSENIVLVAKQTLGVIYKKQGRNIKFGFDCCGLLIYLFEKFGHPIEEPINYLNEPVDIFLKKKLDEYFIEIKKEDIQPGDVFLMNFYKNPQHVGIVSKVGERIEIIHCYDGGPNKVTEHIANEKWQKNIVAWYRFKQKV